MKKLFSLLLALALIVSMIPMVVSAAHNKPQVPSTIPTTPPTSTTPTTPTTPTTSTTPPASPVPPLHHKPHGKPPIDPHSHESTGYGSDTKYHWFQCACGCKLDMQPHIDPKDAADDYCICGYKFSDNADLVTLWIKGCPVIKNFNKNTTEYTLNAYTYKDITEIEIATRTFDSEATVELPEDLTLKEGENKFEIKVTSENQKVTKVYTVTVIKESK